MHSAFGVSAGDLCTPSPECPDPQAPHAPRFQLVEVSHIPRCQLVGVSYTPSNWGVPRTQISAGWGGMHPTNGVSHTPAFQLVGVSLAPRFQLVGVPRTQILASWGITHPATRVSWAPRFQLVGVSHTPRFQPGCLMHPDFNWLGCLEHHTPLFHFLGSPVHPYPHSRSQPEPPVGATLSGLPYPGVPPGGVTVPGGASSVSRWLRNSTWSL